MEAKKIFERLHVSESPFVHYKVGDEKFTMHHNNTQILLVPDGRVELFCVCYWDKEVDEDADPLLFFDPPYMDFLKERDFPIQMVENEELVDYMFEKWCEVEAKKAVEFIDTEWQEWRWK